MKTQTCLYIRESDGKILIGEFLDPPYMDDSPIWNASTDKAKESAVVVADQEKAKGMIWHFSNGKSGSVEFPTPGVYPIPGIRYEVREEITPHAMYSKECWSDWLNQDGIGTHQYSTDEGDRYPFIPISRIRLAYITATDGTAPVVENTIRTIGIANAMFGKKQEPKAEDQHLLWDTALTDAIETESGTIKPYTAMLRYLSEHFTISRK